MEPVTEQSLERAYSAVARRITPGANLIRHWPLTGGVSAHVDAIEFEARKGEPRRAVVRRHGAAAWKPLEQDVTTTEFKLLKTLHEAGFPVPEPLLLDTSMSHLPSPFFVMAMVDGSTTVGNEELEMALSQMGGFLARLHAFDAKEARLPLLPGGDDPVEGALEYIPDTEAWGPLREAIGRYIPTPSNDVLLHGDFWPGNMLWSGGKLAAIIDWEDAAIGNPVSDLAGCRAELQVMYGESAMTRFTRRYLDASKQDVTDLPLWEIYAGFAALATLGSWGLAAEVEAHRRDRTKTFVDRAVREFLHAETGRARQ